MNRRSFLGATLATFLANINLVRNKISPSVFTTQSDFPFTVTEIFEAENKDLAQCLDLDRHNWLKVAELEKLERDFVLKGLISSEQTISFRELSVSFSRRYKSQKDYLDFCAEIEKNFIFNADKVKSSGWKIRTIAQY